MKAQNIKSNVIIVPPVAKGLPYHSGDQRESFAETLRRTQANACKKSTAIHESMDKSFAQIFGEL